MCVTTIQSYTSTLISGHFLQSTDLQLHIMVITSNPLYVNIINALVVLEH